MFFCRLPGLATCALSPRLWRTIACACMALAPLVTQGGVISRIGSVNATISDTNGDGTFDTTFDVNPVTFGLVVRQFQDAFPPTVDFEDRAAIEFDISAIPTNAAITALTLTFQIQSFTGNRIVGVFGYSGDGVITVTDAVASGPQLATYDGAALGLGVHTIALGTTTLQSLIGHTNFFGLRLQGNDLFTNTSIASIEQHQFFGSTPPTITVTYTIPEPVPEPSSLLLASTGMLGTLACRRLRRRRVDHDSLCA